MFGSVTVSYKLGGRSVLPKSWQGKNLVLPYHKFYFVEEGEILVETDGKRYAVGAGELLLLPAKLPHSCALTDRGYAKKSWCHFELLKGGEQFFEHFDLPLKIRVKNKAEVSALFDNCFTGEELGQAAAVLALTAYYPPPSTTRASASAICRWDGWPRAPPGRTIWICRNWVFRDRTPRRNSRR